MTKKFLDICKEVSKRAGLPVLNTVTNNSGNAQARSFLSLANQEIADLVTIHEWQQLQREHEFKTTNTETQSSGLPDDLLRIISDSFWNRTENRRVVGPVSSQEWQRLKATVTSPILDTFMIRNDTMLIQPTPPADQTLAYEYIRKYTVLDDFGTGKETFTLDNDTPELSDELIIRGMLWRYRMSKGESYMQEFQNWQTYLMQLIAQEKGGHEHIHLGQRRQVVGLHIPEGAWEL